VSILTLARGRAFVALVVAAAAALLAAACNGDGGDETPTAAVTPAGETPTAAVTPAAETPDAAAGETPDAAADDVPGGGATSAEVQMVAGPAFSPRELTVAAGADVEITAENTTGFHSFAVYESESAAEGGEDAIAETEACSSPCTDSVTVNLAAGEHFFRCEVHPNIMTGAILAE
jgi:plastocyanin